MDYWISKQSTILFADPGSIGREIVECLNISHGWTVSTWNDRFCMYLPDGYLVCSQLIANKIEKLFSVVHLQSGIILAPFHHHGRIMDSPQCTKKTKQQSKQWIFQADSSAKWPDGSVSNPSQIDYLQKRVGLAFWKKHLFKKNSLLLLHFPAPGQHVSTTPRISNLSLIISPIGFVSFPVSKRLRVFHVQFLMVFSDLRWSHSRPFPPEIRLGN